MDSNQYARRQTLLFQINTILERSSDHSGEEFLAEVHRILPDLERLVEEVENSSSDRLERARSWRYLGNAYYNLGAGKDSVWLEKALAAYLQAESALGDIENPVERVKLSYSYGQTLLGLSGGSNLRLVEEARRKYLAAVELAWSAMPEALEILQKAKVVADQLASLLRNRDEIYGEIVQLVKSREKGTPRADATEHESTADAALFERLLHNISGIAHADRDAKDRLSRIERPLGGC